MSITESYDTKQLLQSFFNEDGTQKKITTVKELRDCLQNAITLEFATIPAYLTAMYSMKDAKSPAYKITKTVVLEEMFHLYQAANLLISIGGEPKLTGEHTPSYPAYIPHADKSKTPLIKPGRATIELYANTFMGIENPAPADAKPESDNFATIGQFYAAIRDGFNNLKDNPKLFKDTKGYKQQQNFNIGNGGGVIIKISNVNDACNAIDQITEQGEGTQGSFKPTERESWGVYNGYEYSYEDVGNPPSHKKSDGITKITKQFQLMYNPADDCKHGKNSTSERSHYEKFKRFVPHDDLPIDIPLPETYPIVTAPSSDLYSQDPLLNNISDIFNGYYSTLLHCLEMSFTQKEAAQSIYFQAAIPLMHTALPTLARLLMETRFPQNSEQHAAPTWTYVKTNLKDVNNTLNDQFESICKQYPDKKESIAKLLKVGQQVQSLFEQNNIDF